MTLFHATSIVKHEETIAATYLLQHTMSEHLIFFKKILDVCAIYYVGASDFFKKNSGRLYCSVTDFFFPKNWHPRNVKSSPKLASKESEKF
jgi:hypothetical protein